MPAEASDAEGQNSAHVQGQAQTSGSNAIIW